MHNKKLIRIIAIVLAVLLAGGVVFGALFSSLAEEQTRVGNAGRHQCEPTMEYLAGEQALQITQRLVYCNGTGRRLTEVVFYAAGNLFRRENAQMYGADDLERVFFAGYTPAGIDLCAVRCDGKPTDFGFQGEGENYLRVSCDVAPGGQCTFEFDYYLLLMRCGAFQGVGDTDVRLSAFCFVPGVLDAGTGQFDMKTPLAHARWLDCEAADYRATLTLPEGWLLCATGSASLVSKADSSAVWQVEAENVRDFATDDTGGEEFVVVLTLEEPRLDVDVELLVQPREDEAVFFNGGGVMAGQPSDGDLFFRIGHELAHVHFRHRHGAAEQHGKRQEKGNKLFHGVHPPLSFYFQAQKRHPTMFADAISP